MRIAEDVQLPKFQLKTHNNITCDNSHYTGNFSCLKLQLVFSRMLKYHFGQEYMPNILLVGFRALCNKA